MRPRRSWCSGPASATWVTRHADRAPDRPAVVMTDRTLTYAELNRRTWQVARTLRAHGVRIGNRVAVLHDNHPEFLPATLAVLRLGAVFVPLNARLADAELAALVSDSRPTVLVTESAADERLAGVLGGATLTVLRTDGPDWPGDDAPADPFDVGDFDEDAAAGLFYTSGTTGLPKGAVITHRNIRSVEHLARRRHRLHPPRPSAGLAADQRLRRDARRRAAVPAPRLQHPAARAARPAADRRRDPPLAPDVHGQRADRLQGAARPPGVRRPRPELLHPGAVRGRVEPVSLSSGSASAASPSSSRATGSPSRAASRPR